MKTEMKIEARRQIDFIMSSFLIKSLPFTEVAVSSSKKFERKKKPQKRPRRNKHEMLLSIMYLNSHFKKTLEIDD